MRRYLGAAVVTVAVAAAWIAMLPQAPLGQPIAFPHAKHQTTGCTVCHRGGGTSARAGIPDVAVCTKCHATAPAGTGAAWDSAISRKTIAWVQVTQLPEHVMFSHRRHTRLGGLSCESCHGDMKPRTAPPSRSPVRLNMTTCLSCHSREGATEDCAACHR
jgi:hypothetical protein